MKDEIISASILLFDDKGYSETSIKDIVDNIGVTKGSFYYYFKSKQELLKDIQLNYINRLLNDQDDIFNQSNKSYREKLYSTIYMVISCIRTNSESARIFNRERRNLTDVHWEEINEKHDKFRLNYQKIIEKGIEAGEFNDHVRPDILTFGILGMTNWSYYWFRPDGEINEEELANFYMEILLNGIKK